MLTHPLRAGGDSAPISRNSTKRPMCRRPTGAALPRAPHYATILLVTHLLPIVLNLAITTDPSVGLVLPCNVTIEWIADDRTGVPLTDPEARAAGGSDDAGSRESPPRR
jgi:hypothetical protein